MFLPELNLNMALKLEVRFGISKPLFGQPCRFLREGVSLKGLSVECSGVGENSSRVSLKGLSVECSGVGENSSRVSLKGLSVECSGVGENSGHTFKMCGEVVLHQLAHQTFVAKCM